MTWLAKTIFVGMVGAGAVGGFMYWLQQPVLEEGQNAAIDLSSGDNIRTVAKLLREQQIAYSFQTRLAGKWYLQHNETLKTGHYLLQGPISWGQLFAKLTKGEAESMTVTFIEG